MSGSKPNPNENVKSAVQEPTFQEKLNQIRGAFEHILQLRKQLGLKLNNDQELSKYLLKLHNELQDSPVDGTGVPELFKWAAKDEETRLEDMVQVEDVNSSIDPSIVESNVAASLSQSHRGITLFEFALFCNSKKFIRKLIEVDPKLTAHQALLQPLKQLSDDFTIEDHLKKPLLHSIVYQGDIDLLMHLFMESWDFSEVDTLNKSALVFLSEQTKNTPNRTRILAFLEANHNFERKRSRSNFSMIFQAVQTVKIHYAAENSPIPIDFQNAFKILQEKTLDLFIVENSSTNFQAIKAARQAFIQAFKFTLISAPPTTYNSLIILILSVEVVLAGAGITLGLIPIVFAPWIVGANLLLIPGAFLYKRSTTKAVKPALETYLTNEAHIKPLLTELHRNFETAFDQPQNEPNSFSP
jgi:hypothetical protein